MKHIRISTIIIVLLILSALSVIIVSIIRMNMETIGGESFKNRQNEKKLYISWWGNDGRHKYTMEGIDIFKQDNPEIDVSCRYGEWNGYEKRTKVWMESHNEADVMQINYAWLDEFSPDGKGFYDLNELKDYIQLDNFSEDELAYGVKGGKLNALPIAMNTHTFYFNQDVLDKYGASIPKTWDDLFAMAKQFDGSGIYVLGMSKKQLFIMLVAYYEQNYGKAMFNDDGTLAIDEEGIQFLLEFYKRMIDENVFCPIDAFDRSKYMSGDIAGTLCWISDTKIYCDGLAESGVNVTRAAYPVVNGAKRSGWYIKPATMWAISAETEHPKEAAKLLDFLLNNPEMIRLQQTEKGVPVSHTAIDVLNEDGLSETNEYKAIEEMKQHQDDMYLMIPNMENEQIIDAFKSGADEYLFDKMSVEECAHKIYDDIKDITAKVKEEKQ